jgi:hypothetical protein
VRPSIRIDRRVLERIAASAGAAAATGWVSASIPFYPARWPVVLALLAAALTGVRPRVGLAFTLAVPVFPLGNVSLGLAVLYAAAAVAWLVLAWPRPRSGLLFAAGALLAPVGALTLMPLVLFRVEGWLRRGIYGIAGTLLTGCSVGELQGMATDESAFRVAAWAWGGISATPHLGRLALVVGIGSAVLPMSARRGELAITGAGAALAAAALVATPTSSVLPLAAGAWLTTAVMLALWRVRGGEPADVRAFGTVLAQTRAFLSDRVKPAGGQRWPQALDPQRVGDVGRR